MSQQRHLPAIPFRRELHRHPHFFLVLLSFVFLGAMATFLLSLSSITTTETQDIRQKAASEAVESILVSFSARLTPILVNQQNTIFVLAKAAANVRAIELDFSVSGPPGVFSSMQITPSVVTGLQRTGFTVTDVAGGKRIKLTLVSTSQDAGTALPADTNLISLQFTPAETGTITLTLDNDVSSGYFFNNTTDQLFPLSPASFNITTATPPNLNPPICSAPTIPPATGTVPLSVTLHGGGNAANGVGLKGYRWDFEGDGTWETGVSIDPIVHVYRTAGIFQPKYQVQNNNDLYSATCVYPYTVTATALANNPATDNLFFTTANKLEFYQDSNNQSIKITDILAGESYKVRQTVRIQNTFKKSDSTSARSVTLQFRANDSGISTRNFAMSQLERASDGIDIIFETSFVGKTDNAFTTTLDTANTVQESAENDNTLLTTYKYEVTTTATATVSATTIASVCNKYCANDGECNYGLKCWYNRCRHPDNVEGERCAPTASVVAGCNISCQTSRDCAAGLSCSSNKCRNPRAISSDTCQITPVSSAAIKKKSEKTTTTGQKGSAVVPGSLQTPTPTVAPTALPSVKPSATPTSTPDSTDRTVLNDLLGWFGQFPAFMQGLFGGGGTENNFLFWLIGGVVLIAVLSLLSLFARRGRRSLPPVPPPRTINHATVGNPPITAVRSLQFPTILPSGNFQTGRSTHHNPGLSLPNLTASSAQFSKPYQPVPSLIAVPRAAPVTPSPMAVQLHPRQNTPIQPIQSVPTTTATGFTAPATVASTPVAANTSSTMLSRLQERGVIKPPATSTTTSTSGFPSQPTA